ncbi:hypothetical protein [Rhodococcus sp. IEGM1428]|uniref:hypothetical protein n=1 Tax=Rhodococcus sp. IEGM1428 TaxID=3392191 RepID=UPI003D0FEC58
MSIPSAYTGSRNCTDMDTVTPRSFSGTAAPAHAAVMIPMSMQPAITSVQHLAHGRQFVSVRQAKPGGALADIDQLDSQLLHER